MGALEPETLLIALGGEQTPAAFAATIPPAYAHMATPGPEDKGDQQRGNQE